MDEDYNALAGKEFDSILSNHIHRAKYGETHHAKKILEEFCACVENQTDSQGRPHRQPPNGSTDIRIDPRIAFYLAECFEKILAIEQDKQSKKNQKAKDVRKALNLWSDTVQADPDRKKKEISIALEVQELIDSGNKAWEAISDVASSHYEQNESDAKVNGNRAVKNAYYTWRIESQAERLSKAIEEYKQSLAQENG